MLIWFCLLFCFLDLGQIVKAGTSCGTVGATKGKGGKDTVLLVL